MPRGRKRKPTPERNAAIGDNSKVLEGVVGDITRLLDEMDSKKGEYMAWCKSQRELINGHLDRAANSGFSKKAIKAVIKTRELEGRIEGIREKLADDNLDETFDQMRMALGDLAETPLGQAALSGKEPKEDPLSGLDSQDEFDRVGAENAAKIEAGITPLPN